jgi:hypothetical protein
VPSRSMGDSGGMIQSRLLNAYIRRVIGSVSKQALIRPSPDECTTNRSNSRNMPNKFDAHGPLTRAYTLLSKFRSVNILDSLL